MKERQNINNIKITSLIILITCALAPLLTAQEIDIQETEQQEIDTQEIDYLNNARIAENLAAFSDPSRIWGNGVERIIEEAYRSCFLTRIIGGKIMNLRMPFAENEERNILDGARFNVVRGGKGNPDTLWPLIEEILDSPEFAAYERTVSDGKEQVIIFDIHTKRWRSSRDFFDIARMKAGSYRGLFHRPYVLVSGQGIEVSDVYNYLYCVGHVGMDCSGFVWYVLSYIARADNYDLGRHIIRSLGLHISRDPAWYVGTSFFNSESSLLIPVKDEIINLRPADIILFRGYDGEMSHSAIIQSVDFTKGIIRYLQCTDEAPLHERGVHESFIYFNPAYPNVSLNDTSLNWSQRRFSPFPGERDSSFSNDGQRYRAYASLGGSRVVRLRPLIPVIERLNKN